MVTDVTDEELMGACKAGSADAFDALFIRYRQAMWGYFRRRVPEAGRAEELAQEVFSPYSRLRDATSRGARSAPISTGLRSTSCLRTGGGEFIET